ncbi:MAG: hypothetical protein FWF49_06090, partial [Oscillospiraceae bacterium]|nr:hypothetical protein [Oscillospiraceae bacterium]
MPHIQIKDNWDETVSMFDRWFHHGDTGRPLMNLWARREPEEYIGDPLEAAGFESAEDLYLNADKHFANWTNYYRTVRPYAEGYPSFSMNLGAGSMALYLGAQPVFKPDTVWFRHFIEDYDDVLPLRYDADNVWWKKHLEIIRRQVALTADTDICVCVPDIVENIDILAALRDPQTVCLDLYDYPDKVKAALGDISDLYMTYYDAIYDLIKRPDGSSAYTAFHILGSGKTAKIQCDCSALLSPGQFEEFIVPSLTRQCGELDNTLYHLDGPECLVHVDALMRIEKLGALQWTPGERNEHAGSERWDDLYRKVREADKGLWIALWDYSPEDAVACADRIVKKFGGRGMYFHFPEMSREQAERL